MASDAKDDPEILAKILARTPLKRLGQADEIASAVAFLLSDDASYVTARRCASTAATSRSDQGCTVALNRAMGATTSS
jgi:NAD(P)-dependent dehydrogenase (short-subunit alcohol dehydrogenase family)